MRLIRLWSNMKKYLADEKTPLFLALFILITAFAILADILILREVLGFLCFTLVPGLIILKILNLNYLEPIKKMIYAIGLSVAFLMFFGLFINHFLFQIGITQPLSTFSLIVSFTIILLSLLIIGEKLNKSEYFNFESIVSYFKPQSGQYLSPLLFSFIFPFLSIFGTILMKEQGNNTILMVMLLLIPLYILAITILRNKIPSATYPVALLMIALALVLMMSLTFRSLFGSDVFLEFYAFRVSSHHLHWNFWYFPHSFTGTLSTSLLPTIYHSLLGIEQLYVYKLVYQLLWSTVPLIIYVISKKYLGEFYGFVAALSFIFWGSMQLIMQMAMRNQIALLFYAFSMLVLFDDRLANFKKIFLFIVFSFSVVVSHYSSSYIFLIIIGVFWFITYLGKPLKLLDFKPHIITPSMLILFFCFIFLWFSQLTCGFDNLVGFMQKTFEKIWYFFEEDVREKGVDAVWGEGVSGIRAWTKFFIYYTTFGLIAFGVFSQIWNYRKTKFDFNYLIIALLSGGILIAFIALPFVSIGYAMGRTFTQMLVILAPMFVIGGLTIAKNKPRLGMLLVMSVLILQLFTTTGLIDQAFGQESSHVSLTRETILHEKNFVYESETVTARWLLDHRRGDEIIYSDGFSGLRFLLIDSPDGSPVSIKNIFLINKTQEDGYLFLRHTNVVHDKIYLDWRCEGRNIDEFSHLFVGRSKIYNSGDVEVYNL